MSDSVPLRGRRDLRVELHRRRIVGAQGDLALRLRRGILHPTGEALYGVVRGCGIDRDRKRPVGAADRQPG